jgi:hypothetical protein
MKYILYYIFFAIIILVFAYINSLHDVEGFTPQLREFYRPYIRNVRVYSEGFYNKQKNNVSNFFRKIGII